MSLEKQLGINMGISSQFVSYRDITKRIKHLIWVKMGVSSPNSYFHGEYDHQAVDFGVPDLDGKLINSS